MTTEETIAKPATAASEPAPEQRQSGWRLVCRRALLALVLLYAVAVAGVWAWMRLASIDSWAISFLLFGPRWLIALPLIVLVPAAAVWRRRLLWLLAVAGLVVLGPILGFRANVFGRHAPSDLRVLTCNLDVQAYDIGKLGALIFREQPDVVAFQEAKAAPPRIVWPEGWHFVHLDELLVASRYPIMEKEVCTRPHVASKPLVVRCLIQMPDREVQFFVLHLLTPRRGLKAVLNRQTGIDLSRVPELEVALRQWIEDSQAASDFIAGFPGAKIVAGDFNMPVESPIYRRFWATLDNAFSTAGLGFGFSKITEEEGSTYGTRIDHLLYTPPWRCVRAWLGADIGSDHRPLVANFAFD